MKHLSGQAVRFLMVGACTTLLQYVILVVMVETVDMRADTASALGYVIAAVANYIASRRFTFRTEVPHSQSAVRYVVIVVAGLTLNTLCMALLAEHWGVPYILAQVLTTGVTTVWNFLGHALWSFRGPVATR